MNSSMNFVLRTLLTLCIPLLLLASAWPAPARQPDREQDVRTAVLTFGDAFADADVTVLETMLTTDYIHVNGGTGNVLSRSEWLNWVTTRRAELDTGALVVDDYKVEDVRVRVYDQTAVVTGVARRFTILPCRILSRNTTGNSLESAELSFEKLSDYCATSVAIPAWGEGLVRFRPRDHP